MASNLTRKELKQDNVALNVEKSFDFVSTNRARFVRLGGIALGVIVVIALGFYYWNAQQAVRQQMLGDAIALQTAPVGQAPPNGGVSFPTEAAKKSAVIAAYQKIVSEHGGSAEAYIAQYSIAQTDVDAGKLDDARKKYQDVADHANANYASLAKLSMAQLDFAQNRVSEARQILKDLQDHPTDLVSKNQATFALAKGLAQTQPEEARKLYMAMAATPSDISQIAVTAMSELPSK